MKLTGLISTIIITYCLLIPLKSSAFFSNCRATDHCQGMGGNPEEICSGLTTQAACQANQCCGWIGSSESTNNENNKTAGPSLIIPELKINLPGLLFSDQNKIQSSTDGEKTFFYVPWIGEYINWLYNYSIGIIALLAIIAIMIGGFYWLLAGGNASRVSEAKSWINAALSGLILALSSYVLLFTINSNLVSLPSIKMFYILKGDIDINYDIPTDLQEDAPDFGPSNHGVPTHYQCTPYAKSILYPTKNGQCNSNLCTSGCGVLSTFMAINKFKITKNLREFTQEAINHGARETYNGSSCNGSTQNGLIPLVRSYGLRSGEISGESVQIGSYLDQGCVVVISVGATDHPSCKFTSGGHFIVLTGWRDKNKKIVDVNDPFGNVGFPNKGDKTWLTLGTWGNCRLSQKFFVCQ